MPRVGNPPPGPKPAPPPPPKKIGPPARNAACPCGSGKKFKKCCLPKQREQEAIQRRVLAEVLIERSQARHMAIVRATQGLFSLGDCR